MPTRLKTSPPTTRSGVSGLLRTTDPSPVHRFTSSSATISLTRDTCSEMTTSPMTMTLPSRHLFFAHYQARPATRDNLSAVTVLNLLQKCVVHFCSQFNIVTGASALPLPSSSCAFADRAPPSSRHWPNGVPCPPEAPRSLRLASRRRYPGPLLRPTRGPCPNYDCTSRSAQSKSCTPEVGQVFNKHLTAGGFPHLLCA